MQRMGGLGDKAVTVRIPEGFAWYALYPDTYAQTAKRWARHHPGRHTTVFGLRSIGTSLGTVVAEQLRRCGVPVTRRFTLRPDGHPFDAVGRCWRGCRMEHDNQGLSLLLQELAGGFGIKAGLRGLAFHRGLLLPSPRPDAAPRKRLGCPKI